MKKSLLLVTILVSMLTVTSLSLPVSAEVSGRGRTLTFNLDVPYYQQVEDYLCSAAVAQMYVEYNTGTSVNQYELFYGPNGIYWHNLEPEYWYADPHGLAYTVSWYVEPTDPATISDYSYDDPYVAIVWQALSIIFYKQPSAALVYNGGHWVLVKGVVLQLSPMVIKGFYVHDPWSKMYKPYGSSFEEDCFVNINAWVNMAFTPNSWGTIWNGKWVTVEYYPEGTHPTEFVQSFSYTVEGDQLFVDMNGVSFEV